MKEITIEAPAKINIGLDVTGVREDGYHIVRMIMQTIGLHDTVVVTKREDDKITMDCDRADLPCDDSNLCIKSARLMIEKYKINHGFHISLTKRIPVAAGMAGGSTDAAAVFVAINELEELGLSKDTLMQISLPIGADVPYCIMQGTALAEGIGEKLTALTPFMHTKVLIAKPPVPVSTKEVYTALDSTKDVKHPDIDKIIEGIEDQDIDKIAEFMGNVLQEVTIPLHPEIEEIKALMKENGAINSMMSGSGPTVFGFFADEDTMHSCKTIIENSGLSKEIFETYI